MRATAVQGAARLLVWALGLWPLGWLAWAIARDALGPDPGKFVVDHFGIWALRLLLLSLAVRPAAELLRRPALIRVRRDVGLFALGHALLHAGAALLYVLGWQWHELVAALAERQYVLLGAAALSLLIPLGLTSTRAAQRRLGRRWRRLHRLVFPAALLATLHFVWLVRSDYAEPLIYLMTLTVLLGYRAYQRMGRLNLSQRG